MNQKSLLHFFNFREYKYYQITWCIKTGDVNEGTRCLFTYKLTDQLADLVKKTLVKLDL